MKILKYSVFFVFLFVLVVIGFNVVRAEQAPGLIFTANRVDENPSATGIFISPTDVAYLNWSVSNAYSCDSSGEWSGPRSTTINAQSAYLIGPLPIGNHIYNMSCMGPGGVATSSVTVTVAPLSTLIPSVTISVSPTSLGDGGTTTLTWSATNAKSCSPSRWLVNGQTIDGISGSQVVGPLYAANSPYTFGLTCNGYYGSGSSSVVVAVTAAPTAVSKLAGLGEYCGGGNAVQCAAGYYCALTSSQSDAYGTCANSAPYYAPTPTAPQIPEQINTNAISPTVQQQLIQLITTLLQLVEKAMTQGLLSANQASSILSSLPIGNLSQ